MSGTVRVGYAAIHRALADRGVKSHGRFILRSYSSERFRSTLKANLAGLLTMLEWDVEHGLLVHRVSSQLVPFGAHPVVDVDWGRDFAGQLAEIGTFVRHHGMRLSFHPGQYTLINSPDEDVHRRAVDDLLYQCRVFDLMGLDTTHKVQIHGGGAYGDMATSLDRFVARYRELPDVVRARLVLENDDFGITYREVLDLADRTGVPVLLDNLHLDVTDPDVGTRAALAAVAPTWGPADGVPLVDYSSQDPEKRVGAHAVSLDVDHFTRWLDDVGDRDLDVVLEIKDKEVSALAAAAVVAGHG
ncbi:UV DNA damage repair endonuclease UvsE [Angustibacter aerolatus]